MKDIKKLTKKIGLVKRRFKYNNWATYTQNTYRFRHRNLDTNKFYYYEIIF